MAHASGSYSTHFFEPNEVISAAFEGSPDAVLLADDRRVYISANAAACELLGLERREIVGKRIDDFTPPALVAALDRHWATFIAAGADRGEYRLLRHDGTFRDVEFTATANVGAGVHFSMLRDVTAQKQREKEFRDSESVAKLALSAGRMGHWTWTAATSEVKWNETLQRIFGLPADAEPTYETFLSLIHADDRAYVRQRIGDTARFGFEYEIEYRVIRPDSELRWITERGQTMLDANGARVGIRGIAWDTTETRAVHAGLRLSELRYRTLLEQSPLSTQLFNASGDCILINRAWTEFWGSDAASLADYNILKDEQLVQMGVMAQVQRAFEGQGSELPVLSYSPGSGKYKGQKVWVRAFVYPVLDDEGRLREVVLIHENVTDQRQRDLERAQQATELARSNAELQRFVYIASHDLKEPLRNMSAFSQMLAERVQHRLTEEESEYLSLIGDGARRMSELIDGLLEYSRASFHRDIVFVESDANVLLRRALDNLRVVVAQTGACVTYGPLPLLRCAPVNLVLLFQNLIANAVKYAAPGTAPRIHVSAHEDESDWVFRVEDSGIGIDPAFHEQIFGIFWRLHGREYAGTGIGLAICKSIVEKHGGKIWVESALGCGAAFLFTLPK